MPFADLETISLPDYLAREAEIESPWFFLHIPKTAGSSFSVELSTRMTPYRNVFIDDADANLTFEEKMVREVRRFMDEMRTVPHRSASGHLLWWQTEPLRAAYPEMRFVTFLRDPVARVISDFRYQRTPMHPLHKEFIATYPTLESFVESPSSQNIMTDHLYGLRPPPAPTPEQLIEHIRRNFTFVGLVEMYPLSFSSIFAAMGFPGQLPTQHQRATPDTSETKVEVTPALRAMIREANSLDQAAFDYVHTVLRRHKDAHWASVKGQAAT